MSEPEPEIDVPLDVRIGVWANDIRVLGDIEDMTLDVLRIAPHDRGASSLRESRCRRHAYSN